MEHVRTRPGMYIGRLGDGSLPEDGIYVLLKEVIDNSIDEFKMNAGKRHRSGHRRQPERHRYATTAAASLRASSSRLVSMLNTGGKYDSKAFKKSVGLNGVGLKAVNALSSPLRGEAATARARCAPPDVFERGILKGRPDRRTPRTNGTYVSFVADDTLFKGYSFHDELWRPCSATIPISTPD
jgi:topoisomerase-4 subunit B